MKSTETGAPENFTTAPRNALWQSANLSKYWEKSHSECSDIAVGVITQPTTDVVISTNYQHIFYAYNNDGSLIFSKDIGSNQAVAATIGNVTGDANGEVACTGFNTYNGYVYRADGSQYWATGSLTRGVQDPNIANINSDPDNEVIFTTGRVYAYTCAGSLLWQSSNPIDGYSGVEPADMNGDGIEEVFQTFNPLSNPRYIYGYWGNGTALWTRSFSTSSSQPTIKKVNTNGDGRYDIMAGFDNGSLILLDGQTGTTLWQINYPPFYLGIYNYNVRAENVDGVPGDEIFIGGYNTTYNALLLCINPITGSVKWSKSEIKAPYLAMGDFDGNGKKELACTSGDDITFFDATSGYLVYQQPFRNVTCLQAIDLDSNGRMDLVAYNISSLYVQAYFVKDIVQSTEALMNGKVTPSTGDTSTQFNFTVSYFSSADTPPDTTEVYIDASPHTMLKKDAGDNNYMDGVEYQYQTTLTAGSHVYYFFFYHNEPFRYPKYSNLQLTVYPYNPSSPVNKECVKYYMEIFTDRLNKTLYDLGEDLARVLWVDNQLTAENPNLGLLITLGGSLVEFIAEFLKEAPNLAQPATGLGLGLTAWVAEQCLQHLIDEANENFDETLTYNNQKFPTTLVDKIDTLSINLGGSMGTYGSYEEIRDAIYSLLKFNQISSWLYQQKALLLNAIQTAPSYKFSTSWTDAICTLLSDYIIQLDLAEEGMEDPSLVIPAYLDPTDTIGSEVYRPGGIRPLIPKLESDLLAYQMGSEGANELAITSAGFTVIAIAGGVPTLGVSTLLAGSAALITGGLATIASAMNIRNLDFITTAIMSSLILFAESYLKTPQFYAKISDFIQSELGGGTSDYESIQLRISDYVEPTQTQPGSVTLKNMGSQQVLARCSIRGTCETSYGGIYKPQTPISYDLIKWLDPAEEVQVPIPSVESFLGQGRNSYTIEVNCYLGFKRFEHHIGCGTPLAYGVLQPHAEFVFPQFLVNSTETLVRLDFNGTDLSLHAYQDGLHLGWNYTTATYEYGFSGANCSCNSSNPQWLFFNDSRGQAFDIVIKAGARQCESAFNLTFFELSGTNYTQFYANPCNFSKPIFTGKNITENVTLTLLITPGFGNVTNVSVIPSDLVGPGAETVPFYAYSQPIGGYNATPNSYVTILAGYFNFTDTLPAGNYSALFRVTNGTLSRFVNFTYELLTTFYDGGTPTINQASFVTVLPQIYQPLSFAVESASTEYLHGATVFYRMVGGTWQNHSLPLDIALNGIWNFSGAIPPLALGGTLEYYLAVQNIFGAQVNSTLCVQLINAPPILLSPADLRVDTGTSGTVLIWTITDSTLSAGTYSIYRDGTLLKSGTWVSGDHIELGVTLPTAGVYKYTIVIDDGLGGHLQQTTWVTGESPLWIIIVIIGCIACGVIVAVIAYTKLRRSRASLPPPAPQGVSPTVLVALPTPPRGEGPGKTGAEPIASEERKEYEPPQPTHAGSPAVLPVIESVPVPVPPAPEVGKATPATRLIEAPAALEKTPPETVETPRGVVPPLAGESKEPSPAEPVNISLQESTPVPEIPELPPAAPAASPPAEPESVPASAPSPVTPEPAATPAPLVCTFCREKIVDGRCTFCGAWICRSCGETNVALVDKCTNCTKERWAKEKAP